MASHPPEPEESQSLWEEKSSANLDQAREAKNRVKQALIDLETKHASKVAAIQEARRRQQAAEAAAVARAKREQEARAAAAFKKALADDMAAKQAGVKQGKRDEANALKQATANYEAARRAETLAAQRARRIADMVREEAALRNVVLPCFKQYRSWYVAVKTCECRLQAREERPAQELIVDQVQSALERELVVLNEARAALKGLVDEGEKLCSEIAETQRLLAASPSRENVLYRRKKVELTILSKSSSVPSLPDIVTPKTPVSPHHGFHMSMERLFSSEGTSQEDLLDRGKDQTKRAIELKEECVQVLANCQSNCNKAIALTNSRLDQRKAEINAVRKRLEYEKNEVAASIRDAHHRVTMLKMKGSHHPQTQDELDEITAAETLLVELNEAKALLDDDWRCKSSAYKIDEFCRNLTPVRAATLFKEPSNSPNASQTLRPLEQENSFEG
jgi:hypothetical protein